MAMLLIIRHNRIIISWMSCNIFRRKGIIAERIVPNFPWWGGVSLSPLLCIHHDTVIRFIKPDFNMKIIRKNRNGPHTKNKAEKGHHLVRVNYNSTFFFTFFGDLHGLIDIIQHRGGFEQWIVFWLCLMIWNGPLRC